MRDTIQTLIPILHLLILASGVLASRLFTLLRARVPQPASVPTARWRRWLLTLLYAPAWSRLSVIVLAGLLSGGLSLLLALLTGQALAPVADAAVAALISQLWHALSLARTLPVGEPTTGIYAGIAARDRAQQLRRKGYK